MQIPAMPTMRYVQLHRAARRLVDLVGIHSGDVCPVCGRVGRHATAHNMVLPQNNRRVKRVTLPCA